MQGFDVFAKFLSYQRLNAYKYNDVDPVALYKWNTELSQALYPLLNTVEIALRNRLHSGISEVVNDDCWLVNKNQKIIPVLEFIASEAKTQEIEPA